MGFGLGNLGGKISDLGQVSKWSKSVSNVLDNPMVSKVLDNVGIKADSLSQNLTSANRFLTASHDPDVLRYYAYLQYITSGRKMLSKVGDYASGLFEKEKDKKAEEAAATIKKNDDRNNVPAFNKAVEDNAKRAADAGGHDYSDDLDRFNKAFKDNAKRAADAGGHDYSDDLDRHNAGMKKVMPECSTVIKMSDIYAFAKKHGVAHSNRFRAHFALPQLIDDWMAADDGANPSKYVTDQIPEKTKRALHYAVDSISIPGINLDTHPVNYGGYTQTMPQGYNVDQVSVVFMCYGDMGEKAVMDRWMHSIYNFGMGGLRFYNDYVADIRVYQTNEYGEETYGVLLRNSYPTAVHALEYNQSGGDITKLSVTFQIEKVIPIRYPKEKNSNRNSGIKEVTDQTKAR